MNRKEKISAILLISFFSIALILSTVNQIKRESSIKANKTRTIGKVTKFYSNRSYNHYYYYYYYNGKKHETHENIYNNKREKCIGKFYIVEISSENPEYSKINLDKEILDSTKIINTGFTFE